MKKSSSFASALYPARFFPLVLMVGLGTLGSSVSQASATDPDDAPRLMVAQAASGERSGPGAPKRKAELKGLEWLRAQPGSRFTLQLLATLNKPDLEHFVREHDLEGPLAHFQTHAKGLTYHVLVNGSYASRVEAESAAARLSGGLKPWIRAFGDLDPVQDAKAAPAPAISAQTPPAQSQLKGPAWLWSRDPSYFTIQLSTTVNRPVLDGELLPDQLALMTSRRDGQRWYSLFYGEFPDKASALAAIGRLPESSRKGQPRPRSFADVHDELSANGTQTGAP